MNLDALNGFDINPIYYVYAHRRLDDNSIFYVGKGKNKRAWSKKLIESVSNKIVVNGIYLFESQRQFTDVIKASVAYGHAKANCKDKYPFITYNGYIIEEFTQDIHSSTAIDYSYMQPIYSPAKNIDKMILRSDGQIFWSAGHAANAFPNSSTSTADWLSKCCKNNKPAMGYEWRLLTQEEIITYVLNIIRNKRDYNEF